MQQRLGGCVRAGLSVEYWPGVEECVESRHWTKEEEKRSEIWLDCWLCAVVSPLGVPS